MVCIAILHHKQKEYQEQRGNKNMIFATQLGIVAFAVIFGLGAILFVLEYLP